MDVLRAEVQVEHVRLSEDVHELLQQVEFGLCGCVGDRHCSNILNSLIADDFNELGSVDSLLQKVLLHEKNAHLHLQVRLKHLQILKLCLAQQ